MEKMENNKLPEILSSDTQKSSWIKNGGYLFKLRIRQFFNIQQKHRELDLESIVINLLEPQSKSLQSDVLNTSMQLLHQQRLLENTRARKRLEKWATNLISIYLIIVCAVLLINALSTILFNIDKKIISDYVISVILSTTTINIIGLGIIVLKGHFNKADEYLVKNDAKGNSPQEKTSAS